MNRLINKLLFLWVGNISMWIFYGGQKKMDEVVKDDNETLGLIVTLILVILIYFLFK